ncbi:MAG: DUF817 domain-containing protein [Verrucomicrobiota bacterium]
MNFRKEMRLSAVISELTANLAEFGGKQMAACLFGLAMMAGMAFTTGWGLESISRMDFLFVYAVGMQLLLIALRLEHGRELVVILAFHVLATVMEWFKTSPEIGSWQYPAEGAIFRVYQVPLFAGFLYSAVGSYLARCWRLFELEFHRYPPVWMTVLLASAASLNFFSHHFIWDFRYVLIGASLVLFGRTTMSFVLRSRRRRVPLLPSLLAVSCLIWLAENIGTYARAWTYPNQETAWDWVSWQKIPAWYLLLMLSFVLVSLVQQKTLKR